MTPLSFNANWYLQQNPDVAAAIEAGVPFNAMEHFMLYGRTEGRSGSPLFDADQYLSSNPDVAEAVAQGLITAWDHFELFGGLEGRSPSPVFDPNFYLQQNPDVAQAIEQGLIQSAVQHFILFGQSEPRAINPALDLGKYISANPDVGAAAANGLINVFDHLLQHGVAEGRNLGNGVSLSDFSGDPVFTGALGAGNPAQALARAGAVAPFIPSFERPAGWAPPADIPIPTDFLPPAGSNLLLVVPAEVPVPPTVVLTPVFGAGTPAPTPAPAPVPVPPAAPPATGNEDSGPPPDTMAPAVPTVALTQDTGTSDSDRITSNGALSVTGIETGASVEYSANGSTWGSGFSAKEGSNTVYVRQTDAAGNVSNGAASLTFTLDTTVPAIPAVELTQDTGKSGSDLMTSNGALSVIGIETGASVEYSVDGSTWGSGFSATEGPNTVHVRQTDVAGNVSNGYASLTFTLDTTAPAAPTLSVLNTGALDVQGESGALTEYSVNGSSSWSDEFNPAPGYNSVAVRQTDAAGNVSEPATVQLLLGTAGSDALESDSNLSGQTPLYFVGLGGADTMNGGAGVDVFVFAAGDSGVISGTVYDAISGFSTSDPDKLDLAGQARVASNRSLDVAESVFIGGPEDVIAVLESGFITVSQWPDPQTYPQDLTTWLAITRLIVTGPGEVAAFKFDQHTYVYQENGQTGDLLIQLTGLTSATALGTTASENTILIA